MKIKFSHIALSVLAFTVLWNTSLPAMENLARGKSIADSDQKENYRALTVGYLPVTCHLTCPVTDYASNLHQPEPLTPVYFLISNGG
jgi:hypothetical protein